MAIYRNGATNQISRFVAEPRDVRAAEKFIETYKPKVFTMPVLRKPHAKAKARVKG